MLKKGPSIVPPFKNYLAWPPPLRYYANHRLCTTSKQQSFYKIPWAGARKLRLPEMIIAQLCTRLWWDPGNISPQRACDLQGHDNVFPALAKSVVKWLLLQTEGSKRAGGMQAALAGQCGRSGQPGRATPPSPAHWHIVLLKENHLWISPASRVTFFLHLVIHSLIYIYYGPLA